MSSGAVALAELLFERRYLAHPSHVFEVEATLGALTVEGPATHECEHGNPSSTATVRRSPGSATTTTRKEDLEVVHIHNPDRVEQLSLLSPDELARVRRLVLRPQEEAEAASRETPCRDGEGRVARKDGYIQDALPGL